MRRIRYIVLLFVLHTVNAQESLNVSLLMPFCSKESVTSPSSANAGLGAICREYYQGMLIAMDSMNAAGFTIRLNVFDTQNDSLVMLRIMQKQSFKESQLIIGPVLQGGNKLLTPFATDKKVYHISPLMTFSRTKLNDEYWISSNPDLPSFAPLVYEFLSRNQDSLNIVVVSDQSALDKAFTPAFKKILPTSKTIKIKTVTYGTGFDVNQYLIPSQQNVLILPTTKEQVANGILYQIKDTTVIPRISCIGFQQWLDFKNADITLWEKRNVHFATTYFVNYSDSVTRDFVMKYREKFASEPSEPAFKGYDQAWIYIAGRYKRGNHFMRQMEGENIVGLQSNYSFVKVKDGGFYQNNKLQFIRFDNNRLVSVPSLKP